MIKATHFLGPNPTGIWQTFHECFCSSTWAHKLLPQVVWTCLNYPLSTVLAFFFLGFFSSLSSTGNEIARYWAFVSRVFPQKELGTLESPPVTAAWAVTSKVLSRESPSALLFGRILGRNHWGLRHGKDFKSIIPTAHVFACVYLMVWHEINIYIFNILAGRMLAVYEWKNQRNMKLMVFLGFRGNQETISTVRVGLLRLQHFVWKRVLLFWQLWVAAAA